MIQNDIIKGLSTSMNELHVEEFFISFGLLFQIIGPEYEMLSLNIILR